MAGRETYEAFVAVMERGSLTAAADQLGRSLQSVSRALAALEDELGVTLIRRTTRRCVPTETGRAFHARIRGALAEIRAAHDLVVEDHRAMTGSLRVASSPLFAPVFVAPVVAEFMKRHPKVAVEFILSERQSDLVMDSFDLAIRIGLLADSSLRARRIGLSRQVVFATPEYIARYGEPQTPADLSRHVCILRGSAGEPETWRFSSKAGIETIHVLGRFRANSAFMCNAMARSGLGIGRAQLWQIRTALDSGEVVTVLGQYEVSPVPVHSIMPPGNTPRRVRAFVDLLARKLAAETL